MEDEQFVRIVSNSSVLKVGHYYLKMPVCETDVMVKVVPQDQLETESGKVWYILHHPRKKKIHVVFYCALSFQGTSE